MDDNSRFIQAESEGNALGAGKRTIWVDSLTGIEYLFVQCGYSGGLTVLYNTDGTPRRREVPETN